MSLLTSHDQAATTINEAAPAQSAAAERVIAVGFLLTVGAAMIGWICMLAIAVWDGANWLMS